MELTHTRICNYCGDIIGARLNFQGMDEVIVCISCVKYFYSIYRRHEEEKQAIRSHVTFNDPIPDHNLVVLQGGKRD